MRTSHIESKFLLKHKKVWYSISEKKLEFTKVETLAGLNGLNILQSNAFDVESSRNIDQKAKLGNGQANGIKIGFS